MASCTYIYIAHTYTSKFSLAADCGICTASYQDPNTPSAEIQCNGSAQLGCGTGEKDFADLRGDSMHHHSCCECVPVNQSNCQIWVAVDE